MWQNFGRFGGGGPDKEGTHGRRRNPLLWIVVIGAILIYSQYDGSLFGNLNQGHLSRMTLPPEEIEGVFALVDQNGMPRTDADFHGGHTLIYFGYTSCPDVCPTSMLVMAQAVEDLTAQGKRVTPLFITVDPERDTVDRLAAYAPQLVPGLVALTGSQEAVGRALASFGVYRRSHKKSPDDTEYLVDHASFVYLMDPDGKFVAHFEPEQGPTRLALELGRHLPG